MRKLAAWVGVLALSTGASAQTEPSIAVQMVDIRGKVLDAYMNVLRLNSKNSYSPAECNTIKLNVLDIGVKSLSFSERVLEKYKDNMDDAAGDIYYSATSLYSSTISLTRAINILCERGSKEIIDLNLDNADIKYRIATLYIEKARR